MRKKKRKRRKHTKPSLAQQRAMKRNFAIFRLKGCKEQLKDINNIMYQLGIKPGSIHIACATEDLENLIKIIKAT
jgi:hypothetical protein